ncbi:methyl-CpG-binding domain-containing protein 13-like isoform X2 [Chenopodium quinoa]|uniref:methyl-CpG-binding domain-containing protein 13-like isoform X2 n=1 Tax=Chenopodium quinoa TaxID=63459 RepID=UPI000B76F555|nr:methyl-CpG-binding domain-containing protein 13-like isoform X2 [Chenopodium quinoa]
MVSKNKSDWPPPGWKVVVKSKNGRKYFINSKTRQKFYSKPSLLRYIRDGCVSNEKPQPVIQHANKKSGELQMQRVEENDFDWLPTGWDLVRRIRKSGVREGTEYKCYIDPSTGSTFYSKPEVLRYLKSKQCIGGTSKQKDKKRSRHSSNKRSVDPVSARKSNLEPKVSQISKTRVRKSLSSGNLKVVTERTVDEDLPSGWIKETRIKMLGNKVVRRDPFLYDPASRLVFRSKLEVLRYVETGEISRHAYQRKTGSGVGEDSANGKTSTSSELEETPKRRTRNMLFPGESSSNSIQELPEDSGDKKVEGRKSRRLSSRGKPATARASSLKQSKLSPISPSKSQELVAKPSMEKLSGTKESVSVTKHAPSEVQDDGSEVSTLEKSESPAPRDLLPEENQIPLAVQDCSNGKASTSKRKTSARKLVSAPSRSSKRLAGVEAKVVFHSIPIEHTLRATSRKPSRTKPIPSLESVPDGLQEKCHNVDKQNVLVSEEEEHQTVVANAVSILTTHGEPTNTIDDLPSQEEKHCTMDVNSETLLTTEEETLIKIDDFTSEEQNHYPLNVDSESVLAAVHEEASNQIDRNILAKETLLVDLSDLQLEEAPPGFSESMKVEVSSAKIQQSFEHPPVSLQGSKVENTSSERPIVEEKLASVEKEIGRPQSEYCFPPPLWSDPCLEFAFKTLTGAIPFDDNLAIQDYIQHQLRTSEDNDNNQCLPDVCAPSGDETIKVPQLPEDVNIPNSNGFGSPEIKQVKN